VRDARGGIAGRIWAFRDVTAERATRRDLDQHAARLESANAALERASQANDLFLANLSHELRTPLSVIIGYLNLVLEGGLSAEETRDFVRRSNRSAIHLLQLISDMLDLTRLESGTAVIEVAPLAVVPVVEEVRALTEVLATAKGLRLEVATEGDPWVLADAQRLKQILLNLVGNALKFTAEGGVTVTVAAVPGEVCFAVRDTGSGIPAAQQELLFNKFMRLDSRPAAPADGVGLGLSICRELVTLMNGTIVLESQGLGCGTEVRFTLPSAASKARRTAANP
jgi:signal transduction histidine kinase